MAVGFGARMTGGNGVGGFVADVAAGVTLSSSGMTVGASDTIILAPVVWRCGVSAGPTARTMTWDGVSMTEGPSVLVVLGGADSLRAAIWYLRTPNIGNKILKADWTTACDLYMGCASYTGADINTGDNTTATDVTTLNIPTDSAGATVGVFGVDGAFPTMNFTTMWAEDPFNPGGGANWTLGGTGTNGHTFTGGGGTHQVLAGVHLIASGGGGSTYPLMGQILQ